MKRTLTLALVAISLSLCGCKIIRHENQIVKLEKNPTLAHDRVSILDEGEKITSSTEWASACPYCGTINISHTCLASGGAVTNAVPPPTAPLPPVRPPTWILQYWSISYICRNCEMPYADERRQFLRDVNSIKINDE